MLCWLITPPTKKLSMTFTIIGTGNVAQYMLHHLTKAGHQCIGIWGRDMDAASNMATAYGAVLLEGLNQIKDTADFCILAVADDAIGKVAAQLLLNKTTVIHCSGSVGLETLPKTVKNCGVLWPIGSIVSKPKVEEQKFPIAWEASSEEAFNIVKKIAEDLGSTAEHTTSEQRKHLHLAAVITNNFIYYLGCEAQEICTANKLPFKMLEVLLLQTFEKIGRAEGIKKQTGPASRVDLTTIEKQVKLLAGNDSMQEVYMAVSRAIIDGLKR